MLLLLQFPSAPREGTILSAKWIAYLWKKNNYMTFFLRTFHFLRLLAFCYIKMYFLLERRTDKRNGPEVFNSERGELQTEIFS